MVLQQRYGHPHHRSPGGRIRHSSLLGLQERVRGLVPRSLARNLFVRFQADPSMCNIDQKKQAGIGRVYVSGDLAVVERKE
jgi:hypothetical protein